MMRQRGFTYIEVSVTILVIALSTAIVTPQMKNLLEGQQIASFRSGLKRMPIAARELAISRNQTMELAFDESNNELVVRADTSSSSQTAPVVVNSATPNQTDESASAESLSMPTTVEATSFLLESQQSDSGNWSIKFYPDGTCESGGIQFTAGQYEFSLSVREDGRYTVGDGDIVDLKTETWQAGDYEQRTN